MWCGLLRILALSSVIRSKINIFYPNHGSLENKILFNQKISPRTAFSLILLLCYKGILSKKDEFRHNHYVPLAFRNKSMKRLTIVKKESMRL